jgi:hypothetical protein
LVKAFTQSAACCAVPAVQVKRSTRVLGGLVTWRHLDIVVTGDPAVFAAAAATVLLSALCRSVPMSMFLSAVAPATKGSSMAALTRTSLVAV